MNIEISVNLATYTLNISNSFSLQYSRFSLQIERWMCQKYVLYDAAMLLFLTSKMRYLAL